MIIIILLGIFWWLLIGLAMTGIAKLLITHGKLQEHFITTELAYGHLHSKIDQASLSQAPGWVRIALLALIVLGWGATGPFLIVFIITDAVRSWLIARNYRKRTEEMTAMRMDPPSIVPANPTEPKKDQAELHKGTPEEIKFPPSVGTPGSPA